MATTKLTRTKRHLPHWDLNGGTYFVTFHLKAGAMPRAERRIAYDHIRVGDGDFYRLFALVIMPDHVHLLAKPKDGICLSRMMKGIKGVTAKKINARRGASGAVWLGESYDRIVRDEAEAIEKQNYIYQNPVRAGIVERAKEYPYSFIRALS